MNGIRAFVNKSPESPLVPSATGDTARRQTFVNQEMGSNLQAPLSWTSGLWNSEK